MSNSTETHALEAQNSTCNESTPHSRSRRVFMPRADVYETPDSVVILAEMPGVDENSVDITMEKNVLAILGRVEHDPMPENARLAYEEYEIGDYQRAFTLSEEIDRDKIEASLKQGVMRITLPKYTKAQARKIQVKAGV